MNRMTKYIVSNSLICGYCDDHIYSSHRHDLVTCKCGKSAVDGGQAYLRRVGDGTWTDTSIRMDESIVFACRDAIQWGTKNGKNELGTALAVLRALDEHKALVKD